MIFKIKSFVWGQSSNSLCRYFEGNLPLAFALHYGDNYFGRYIFLEDLGFCAFYWYQILLLLATLGGAHARGGRIC